VSIIKQNKRKIVNDPIYGFIQIPSELIYDIIQHPFLQRLRRIKQLGLTYYIYPGATHTRFQHVLGASHLMKEALNILKSKGHDISDEEYFGAIIAILLHDLGHGPFSHTLETSFFKNISHEELSIGFMNLLNKEFNGALKTGIEIFINNYPRKFLHQLVSSQLDMDRLDYLRRDSYYTGVSEGVVGSDRIIKMLDIFDNELVIEEKGIYSIEKFLIARRLMYWQVYLHKTVIASEQMLIQVVKRAKKLHKNGEKVFLTPALKFFFDNNIKEIGLINKEIEGETPLEAFSKLDDHDIIVCIKQWQFHQDKVLSILSKGIINRDLFKVTIQPSKFKKKELKEISSKVMKEYKLSEEDLKYFVISDSVKNNAYSKNFGDRINILEKNEKIRDIAVASDVSNVATLSRMVEKFFICHPKL
jgi:HD superfamily phosphohydrolase